MTIRTLCVVVAFVLAMVGVAALQSQRQPVEIRPIPADVATGMYDRIQLSVIAATARNDQAARACESEVTMILAREFPEIERTANLAAEEVSTLGSCSTIIYRLAKEKLGQSSSTADYVEGEIRGRLQPAIDACGREIDVALRRYEVALRESTVTLASELAQSNDSATGSPMAIQVDVRSSGDLDATLREIGLSGGILTVVGAFDAVAIMNTNIFRSLITKIAQLAASIFAKPAATAAGSAIIAAADGPLPIGDALAIVGGLWTGYEIYAARAHFEQQIKASLTNALPEMKRDVHHQIMERILSLRTDYQHAQDRIRNEMAATLNR